jgi:hypothetical protein
VARPVLLTGRVTVYRREGKPICSYGGEHGSSIAPQRAFVKTNRTIISRGRRKPWRLKSRLSGPGLPGPPEADSPQPSARPAWCVYRQPPCWRSVSPARRLAVHARGRARLGGEPQSGLVAAGRLEVRARERGAAERECGNPVPASARPRRGALQTRPPGVGQPGLPCNRRLSLVSCCQVAVGLGLSKHPGREEIAR